MRELIYAIDKWTAYLWKNLLRDSAVIREHVERGATKVATFPSFAREVFARLYSPPPPIGRVRAEDAWATTLHGALDELPAFKKLAAYCARNKEFASAATANLLEQIVDKLPSPRAPFSDPELRRQEVRGLLDFLDEIAHEHDDASRSQLEAAIAAARDAGKDAVGQMSAFAAAIDAGEIRQSLRRSVDEAALEVEEVTTAAAGLAGLGGVANVSDLTHATLGAALKDSAALRRLGMLAGRMRRLAMAKRRSRTRHAASELSDITTGNDLAHLLPHELLKLADPLLALDFLRSFGERSLLQYELSGNEREGRGPVVVLIDDSDSMDGAPATFARAAALALADVALADRRSALLIRFSHKINATLKLSPSRDATAPLLAFLGGPVGGGTSFELPLLAAREAIERELMFERADVVLITDGEAELSAEFLLEWKRRASHEGLTTYAVHIGTHAPAVLRALTTEVIELRALLPDRLEEALFAKISL